MKLRHVTPFGLSAIERANADLAGIVTILRLQGARKAADAVARARKSVGGAIRHAQRCIDAKKA